MSKLFISHSTQDDGFVRVLQQMLGDLGQDVWIDSRQIRGGDPLWSVIQQGMDDASAYAVVVSPDGLQSNWVGKELRYALELQKQRGREKYPVIPLSLNDTKLGVLEAFFAEDIFYIPVSSAAGGVEVGMNAILVALGKRLPADVPVAPQPPAQPLEELVLKLSSLTFHEQNGARRAAGHAQLVYEPATPGQPHVHSAQQWLFVAPLGPIEAEELRWYLEKFAIWPSEIFRPRAQQVEQNLIELGRRLYAAALPVASTANVLQAWAKVPDDAGRRFSVHVDSATLAGAPAAEQETAREAATLLLGLPWELLYDDGAFLFQGAKPVRVRRRLPGTRALDVPVMSTPIRILLITARPEDDACSYIDHRASALPLVDAMEELGGLVRIHVLSPPTLPALREELERARKAKEPYHVVHFDGHGVYDRHIGLGGLCFEDPQDIGKLVKRGHKTVFTNELDPLLRDHRIPLIFLEACQTAQAEKASESVASELLKIGVASVVAMSHSVLVETARRFVKAFYEALAHGARVGDAMLEGQRRLKDDTFRASVFGVGELRLEDWFVPVLFQEKEDPQLFRTIPGATTQATTREAHLARMGELPAAPATGFIGRSRELLALQRLLRHEQYAVVRGQGGEGKTALAAEFARWMVRSHQVRRAAFVSVETHANAPAVTDALGRQLVGSEFSAAGDLEQATQQLERALREQSTLLVVDNMESVLLPPFIEQETPEALSDEAGRELKAILAVCARLLKVGDTRLIFTSREGLPAPFDAERQRRELHRLDSDDAVKFVERVLNADGGGAAGAALEAAREAIEELVDKVHGHARTLTLLAPSLRSRGAAATFHALDQLMAEMDRQYPPGSPGIREKSVFASVELSLRRMSPANRDKARVLGVFHGGFKLEILGRMMKWEEAEVVSLAVQLIGTGLATPNRYNHLTLNPALCPYLRGRMQNTERETLTARWVEAMRRYTWFLDQQLHKNAEVAATLTVLELPNLLALLDLVQHAGDAESTIGLATSLYSLLQRLGRLRLLEHVGQVRDTAAKKLEALSDAWNHARFQAARTSIEQQLGGGRMVEAIEGAQHLIERARTAGGQAYPDADYDLAMARWLLARVLQTMGGSEQALPLLDEARQCFEVMAKERSNKAAEGMASVCFAEQGDCLVELGRLDEAVAAYEENIRRAEQLDDARQVAVSKGQLGDVWRRQRRYAEALAAYAEAHERFTLLDEPGSIAVGWHQTGIVYQEAGQPEAAEDAYRKSLAIWVRLGDVAGQAGTLGQLANLYKTTLGRTEESVPFYREAADKYSVIRDVGNEGKARSGLAIALRILHRLNEARQEIRRSIKCAESFGHSIEPWKIWGVLSDIEADAENTVAAIEANRKAIACYLAYRRDGGENHDAPGRLCLAVTQALLASDSAAAASILEELDAEPNSAWLTPFIHALQAIVAGRRDRTLADASDMHCTMAAEVLFLLETLEKAGK